MDKVFLEHFAEIEDPRIERCKRHALLDILFLSVCAVLAGADGWEAIEDFGQTKLDWLRKYVPLGNGIPRHDTIARVLCRLDPEALQKSFIGWMQGCVQAVGGQVVAIDGKTVRRSFDTASRRNSLHLVSAWAVGHGVVLGQVKTAAKSNEITAIPALLELLELKGAIVTLDAMGCQKVIAAKIREKKADYVLALKANQKGLYEPVEEFFATARKNDFKGVRHEYVEHTDSGHGRVEVRRCWQSLQVDYLPGQAQWAGLRSMALVESERHVNGKLSVERRYYLSSLPLEASALAQAVRAHWGVENGLHWVLDVTYREDDSRIRRGHAAENFSTLRRLTLNLLKQETSRPLSQRKKRMVCGWDDGYREKVLFGRTL